MERTIIKLHAMNATVGLNPVPNIWTISLSKQSMRNLLPGSKKSPAPGNFWFLSKYSRSSSFSLNRSKHHCLSSSSPCGSSLIGMRFTSNYVSITNYVGITNRWWKIRKFTTEGHLPLSAEKNVGFSERIVNWLIYKHCLLQYLLWDIQL